jgi:hypothetical protein
MQVCDTGGGDNCFVMDTTSFDPYGVPDWKVRAEAFGETLDLASDMPGTNGSPADFNQLRSEIGSNWETHSFENCSGEAASGCGDGGNGGQNPCRYHLSWIAAPPRDHFRIWTDPLNTFC